MDQNIEITRANNRKTIQALGWAKKFLFAVSVTTSSFFLYKALGLGEMHWFLSTIGAIAVIATCLFMDFVGVGIILPTGLQNTIASFVDTGRYRPLVMFANFGILVVGLSMLGASAYTSYYGSTIAGAAVAGSFDAAGMLQPLKEQRLDKEAALAPLRMRIDSLNAQKEQAIAEAAGQNLLALKKRGNGWAKGQVDSIAGVVSKSYDEQISQATKSLAEIEKAETANFTTVTGILNDDIKFKAEAHKSKSEALQLLSRYAGLVSIILAFICEIIISLLTVAATTTPAATSKKKNPLSILEKTLEGKGPNGSRPEEEEGGKERRKQQAIPLHMNHH